MRDVLPAKDLKHLADGADVGLGVRVDDPPTLGDLAREDLRVRPFGPQRTQKSERAPKGRWHPLAECGRHVGDVRVGIGGERDTAEGHVKAVDVFGGFDALATVLPHDAAGRAKQERTVGFVGRRLRGGHRERLLKGHEFFRS